MPNTNKNHGPDKEPKQEGSFSIEDLLSALPGILGSERESVEVLSKNSDGNGLSTVYIGRRPRGEAIATITTEGLGVDWKEKFTREQAGQFPPFQPGELVSMNGFVSIKDGRYLLHVDADGRIADNFYLHQTAPDDVLQEHVGLPLSVLVQVENERSADFRISDIWNYDAEFRKILSVPVLNPTTEQIEALTTGTRVIVRGTFLGFNGKPDLEWYENYESGHVRLDDGTDVYLDFPHGQCRFSGGGLENLAREYPQAGDQVSFGAYVSRAKRKPNVTHEGYDGGVRLAVDGNAPCVLNSPSQERSNAYQSLRTSIGTELDSAGEAITSGEFAKARSVIAKIRLLEVTEAELDGIDDLVSRMPESELPFLIPRKKYSSSSPRNYTVRSVNESFGVNVESLTKEQFVEFCEKAVRREFPLCTDTFDDFYLYCIGKDAGIDPKALEGIATTCLECRLPIYRESEDPDFDVRYSIERALAGYAIIGTESATQALLDTLYEFAARGEFQKTNERSRKETFVANGMRSLSYQLKEVPQNVLADNLVRLSDMRNTLAAKSNEVDTLRILDHILDYIRLGA